MKRYMKRIFILLIGYILGIFIILNLYPLDFMNIIRSESLKEPFTKITILHRDNLHSDDFEEIDITEQGFYNIINSLESNKYRIRSLYDGRSSKLDDLEFYKISVYNGEDEIFRIVYRGNRNISFFNNKGVYRTYVTKIELDLNSLKALF